MNGKIDEKGRLCIERAGQMVGQNCPNRTDKDFCGDWCPLFSEPAPTEEYDSENDIFKKTEKTAIYLCQNQLVLDNFTDERK